MQAAKSPLNKRSVLLLLPLFAMAKIVQNPLPNSQKDRNI